MNEQLLAKEYVKSLYDDFIKLITEERPTEILKEKCNILHRDIIGYHGREVFELLQNADDAYQKSIDRGSLLKEPLIVHISYKHNILTVQNTGTTFDKDGVLAIIQGNNSSKVGDYIGYKGTGFRSILNWTDDIEIHSGYYHIKFSKQIADNVFESIKHFPQIKKQIEKKPDIYIPILSVPQYIEQQENFENKTEIKIHIRSDTIHDNYSVMNQLKNIDTRILLFLPNISKIIIETDELNIIYQKNEYEHKEIELIKNTNNEEYKEYFYVYHKRCNIENNDEIKQARLSIAIPKNFESFYSNYLYTYFPLLDTDSPFNCILHATYTVGDQRNTINRDNFNEIIVKEQLNFLIEVAKEFINRGYYEIGYKILIPFNYSNNKWAFNKPFYNFNVEQYYIELLCKEDLLVTVNNDIMSINNGAKYIPNNYPTCFSGDVFSCLIKSNSSIEKLVNLIEKNSHFKICYDSMELCNLINEVSMYWTIEAQVQTFIWWNTHYSELLPKLLKTNNNTWLKYKEQCYLLEGNIYSYNLPLWVKIPSLHTEYQNELLRQYKKLDSSENIIRNICQSKIFSSVEFKHIDARSVISAVNSSIDNNYEYSIEFIKWLWKTYKDKADDNWLPYTESNNKQSIKFNFPNNENKVVDSNSLFFGSNYGNKLGEKLFDDSFSSFLDFSEFSIDENDKARFIRFISKFGVCQYPRLEENKYNLDPIYYNMYYNYIKKSGDIGGRSSSIDINFNIKNINNLKDLLENILDMEEIFLWVSQDKNLYNHLDIKIETQGLQYKGSIQSYFRYINIEVLNYIRYVFNKSKWIKIGDKKYSPLEIIYNITSRKRGKLFNSLVPTITEEFLEKIARNTQINIIDLGNILDKLEFCKEVIDLNSNDFYGLMLQLPEQLNYIDLYKEVYLLIDNYFKDKQYIDSDNKIKFYNEGKLLVKKNGKYTLSFAKDSYVPSIKIINGIDIAVVTKNKRTGNKNFINIFGCKEYKKTHIIKNDSIVYSPANEEFQKYFSKFKKYLQPFFEFNSNIKTSYSKINIFLVKSLSVVDSDNNIEQVKEEFIFFRDDINTSVWYITMSDTTIKNYINELSIVVGDIFNHIANSDGFDYKLVAELFRSNNTTRNFLLEENFNISYITDNEEDINHLKNNFIETIQSICPDYSIENISIDFDNFDSISNYQKIIELFKELRIDISDFNQKGFVYPINVDKYYKELLKEYIENANKNDRYMNYLYTKALENKELQTSFMQTVYSFNDFDYEYENSVYVDYSNVILTKFGNYMEYPIDKVVVASIEYKKNFDAFNIDEKFKSAINNKLDVQNLIYFNKKDEFKIIEKDFIDHMNQDQNVNKNILIQYNDILPIKKEIKYSKTINFSDNISLYRNIQTPNSSLVYVDKYIAQKELGNRGEYLIYVMLCEKFGKDNVKPCSEAFIDLGILLPGQCYTSEYDLRYTDNGVTYYVEVKTGHSNLFYMSNNELKFAKENADKYKLFLVYDIFENSYTYTELPIKFWEDNVKFRQIYEKIRFEF